MAKGNDGNYFQHSIEVESAMRLAKTHASGRLHIALTHGMAPYEPLDQPSRGQARRRLESAMADASQPPKSDELPVVAAYRETKASRGRYPNSAELLRSIVGTDELSGGITEVDSAKHKKLADAWSGSCVLPVCSSWRCQVKLGGILTSPVNLKTPWLFSMDPMTYIESGNEDDCLHRTDIDRLSGALSSFLDNGMPGIATLFVYNVQRTKRPLFWDFVDELATCIGADTNSYWITHQGGNRNLVELFHTKNIQLPQDFPPPGIKVGRT